MKYITGDDIILRICVDRTLITTTTTTCSQTNCPRCIVHASGEGSRVKHSTCCQHCDWLNTCRTNIKCSGRPTGIERTYLKLNALKSKIAKSVGSGNFLIYKESTTRGTTITNSLTCCGLTKDNMGVILLGCGVCYCRNLTVKID